MILVRSLKKRSHWNVHTRLCPASTPRPWEPELIMKKDIEIPLRVYKPTLSYPSMVA